MSDYVKLTDFAAKDSLLTGNPAKIVKGTEIDDEFAEIAVHIATKANKASPALTGVPTAPTAAAQTNTTQVATTAFVQQELLLAVPVGALILMAFGSPVPTGYLVADGSAVSRAGYPTLFALIGTTFGSGDGSTTFNVPNLTSDAGTEYYIKYV